MSWAATPSMCSLRPPYPMAGSPSTDEFVWSQAGSERVMGHFEVEGVRMPCTGVRALELALKGPFSLTPGSSPPLHRLPWAGDGGQRRLLWLCPPPAVHGVHRGAALHEVSRLQHPNTGHQVWPRSPTFPHPNTTRTPTAALGAPLPWGPAERGGHREPCPIGSALHMGTRPKGAAADRWVERGEGRWPWLGLRTMGQCCRDAAAPGAAGADGPRPR